MIINNFRYLFLWVSLIIFLVPLYSSNNRLKKLDKNYLIKLQNHLLFQKIAGKKIDYEYLSELVFLLEKYNFPVQSFKALTLLKEKKPELIKSYNLQRSIQKVIRKVALIAIKRADQFKKEQRHKECVLSYYKAVKIDRTVLEELTNSELLTFCIKYLESRRQKNQRKFSVRMILMLGYFHEISNHLPDAINMYKWALSRKRGLNEKERKKVERRVRKLLTQISKELPKPSKSFIRSQKALSKNPAVHASQKATPGKGRAGETVAHMKKTETLFEETITINEAKKFSFADDGYAISVQSENIRAEIEKSNFQQLTLIIGTKGPKEYFFDAARQIGDPYETGNIFKYEKGNITYLLKLEKIDRVQKRLPNLFGDKILNLQLFDRVDLKLKVTRSN